jgi:hypothetical protein
MAILIAFLISLIVLHLQGFYVGNSYIILMLLNVLVIAALARKRQFSPKNAEIIAAIAVAAYPAFILYNPGLRYPENTRLFPLFSVMLIAVNLITVSHLFFGIIANKRIAICLIAAAAVAYGTIVSITPHPKIDVYAILQEAPEKLLRGENPYSIEVADPLAHTSVSHYAYAPAMIYTTAPFVWVTGDVRYGMVILLAATAVFLVVFGNGESTLAGLMGMLLPVTPFLIEQSYTEPVVLAWFVATLYAVRKKHLIASAVLAGLLLATKHYVFIIMPYLVFSIPKGQRLRWSLVAASTFLLACLPFAAWDWTALKRSLLDDYIGLTPRADGLSVYSFLSRLHLPYPPVLPWACVAALYLWGIPKVMRGQIGTVMMCAVTLLVFFSFNAFASGNYYFLISELFIISSIFDEPIIGEHAARQNAALPDKRAHR